MSENTAIWDQVCETNPSNTTKVKQGPRQFTTPCAYSQIRKATELWGPYGTTWGLADIKVEMWGVQLVKLEAQFRYPDGIFPMINTIKHTSNKGMVDDDHLKKLQTDTLTKALSLLGFNADIFLGKFDDNRYVQAMAQKHAQPQAPPTNVGQAAILQQIHAIGSKIYDDWKYECGAICAEVTKETTPDNIRTKSTDLTMPELKEVLARINTDKTAREQA